MSGSGSSDSRWWVRILAVGLGALLSVALVPVVEPGSPAAAAGQTSSGLRTAAADAWVPRAGLVFNRPRGSQKMRAALIRRVIAGIKHAPPGSRLSFAMYSFDRRDVANALIKAHRRGVQVQLIINDNWTSSQTRRLRNELGGKPRKKNFVVICKGSCRGGKGNLHMKVYAFSQTGAATKVIMTGSGNLTNRAVSLQWNDQTTILDRPELYDTYLRVFQQLKFDRRVSPRRVAYTEPDFDALFYKDKSKSSAASIVESPQPARVRPSDDPVLTRLKRVSCSAPAGYGVNGRTSIRITMYGWNRFRGSYLARRVAYLKRQGCDIKVILSVPSRAVTRILTSNRIPVKSADYGIMTEQEEGKQVNFYSHLKVMVLDGTYQGEPTKSVWTGSENWSPMSFKNDELIIRLQGAGTVAAYTRHFNYMWNGFTHPLGVRPTNLP